MDAYPRTGNTCEKHKGILDELFYTIKCRNFIFQCFCLFLTGLHCLEYTKYCFFNIIASVFNKGYSILFYFPFMNITFWILNCMLIYLEARTWLNATGCGFESHRENEIFHFFVLGSSGQWSVLTVGFLYLPCDTRNNTA